MRGICQSWRSSSLNSCSQMSTSPLGLWWCQQWDTARQILPYLDALVEANADISVLDGAFTKPQGFRAGDEGRSYEQVLESTVLDAAKLPEGAATVTSMWIIDDIYNTGNTVGAMTTRLKEHVLALEELVVVCPLYVPL